MQRTAEYHKRCFYVPAIALRDKNSMSVERRYLKEISLKRASIHSN